MSSAQLNGFSPADPAHPRCHQHLWGMEADRGIEIGDAYVLSSGLPDIVRPYLERLAEQTQETASLTVLHRDTIFYVDRVQADRVLTVEIVVGTSCRPTPSPPAGCSCHTARMPNSTPIWRP